MFKFSLLLKMTKTKAKIHYTNLINVKTVPN